MSPDEIHRALARHYPSLVAQRRKNPSGWAFYLYPPQKGVKSNRIIRATRSSPDAETRVKLAVSSRRGTNDAEFAFAGDVTSLRKYVDKELHLFEKHFAE